jgi:hypothetical protein
MYPLDIIIRHDRASTYSRRSGGKVYYASGSIISRDQYCSIGVLVERCRHWGRTPVAFKTERICWGIRCAERLGDNHTVPKTSNTVRSATGDRKTQRSADASLGKGAVVVEQKLHSGDFID